jgi:zinc protease
VPELRSRFAVELEDPRVNQESLRQYWRVPSYTTASGNEGEALDVLAEILGGGSTSRLYRALVRGDGPASSAGAWYQSTALDDTKLGVYAVPKDGVAMTGLEPLIRAEIDRIAEDGVTEEELARAKTSLVASAVYAQDSQSQLARIFGAALVTGSTVADVKAWPREIAAITSADVERVAAAYLKPTTVVTGRLLRPADEPKT